MKATRPLELAAVLAATLLSAACTAGSATPNGPSSAPVVPPPPAPAATPQPATTPSPPAVANSAPEVVVKLDPRPPAASVPFTLSVDLCKSTDADGDRLRYAFEFEREGKVLVDHCREQHTYTSPGTHRAYFCASDGDPEHLACRTFEVEARP